VITDAQVAYLLQQFTNNIRPTDTSWFGEPFVRRGDNAPLVTFLNDNGIPTHQNAYRNPAGRDVILVDNVRDVREQLAALVPAGFVTRTGLRRLPDLMRYLVAVDRRLQQMPTAVQRDTTRMEKVHEMQDEYAWLLEQLPPGRPVPSSVLDIRWMIEELRVSYFAHALGTAYPVSDKRIVKAIDAAAP